jgi:hypothetical protein
VRARGARADSPPNEAEHEESSSFLKKRTKKLLSISRTPARMGELTNRAKVFCFFFSKKKSFLAALACQSLRGLVAISEHT